MGDELFREKVFATMLYGFKTIKKPVSVTVDGMNINEKSGDQVANAWKFDPDRKTFELTIFKKTAEKVTIALKQ